MKKIESHLSTIFLFIFLSVLVVALSQCLSKTYTESYELNKLDKQIELAKLTNK
jgi:uncharacterized lipoprotein YehR (DUF1307 family)